jgi:hypothetical protein
MVHIITIMVFIDIMPVRIALEEEPSDWWQFAFISTE